MSIVSHTNDQRSSPGVLPPRVASSSGVVRRASKSAPFVLSPMPPPARRDVADPDLLELLRSPIYSSRP